MITEKSYLEAKKIINDYCESQQLNTSGVSGSSIPKPPEPPLSRVLREGVGRFCTNCGSTVSKNQQLQREGISGAEVIDQNCGWLNGKFVIYDYCQ